MAALAAQLAALAIPADGAVFTGALACHIAAGLTCVISGALATTAAKRPGRHTIAGTVYFWSLTVVFASVPIQLAWYRGKYRLGGVQLPWSR